MQLPSGGRTGQQIEPIPHPRSHRMARMAIAAHQNAAQSLSFVVIFSSVGSNFIERYYSVKLLKKGQREIGPDFYTTGKQNLISSSISIIALFSSVDSSLQAVRISVFSIPGSTNVFDMGCGNSSAWIDESTP